MRLIKWLGAETNSRAITTLLLIGGFIGGGIVYTIDNVVPRIYPEFGKSSYAQGYRAGKRETELTIKKEILEQNLKRMKSYLENERELNSLSSEQLYKRLQRWVRD